MTLRHWIGRHWIGRHWIGRHWIGRGRPPRRRRHRVQEGVLDRPPKEPWSARTYLIVGVVAVSFVFVLAGWWLSANAMQRARTSARRNASGEAVVAARTVTDSIDEERAAVAAAASDPAVIGPLERPTSSCTLPFDRADPAGGRLDLVTMSGAVACSTAGPGRGGRPSDEGAPWLPSLAAGPRSLPAPAPVVSGPYTDRFTGRTVVAVVARVAGPGGAPLGAVAGVITTGSAAPELAHLLGGPEHFQFALFDAHDGTRLSASAGGRTATTGHPFGRLDALYGRAAVPQFGWVVFAGERTGSALSGVRLDLARELGLGAACLAILIVFALVVNRRITRPLARLADLVGRYEHLPLAAETAAAVGGPAEVRRLGREFGRMIEARDGYEAQLSHQAFHDPLTGLPNRALLHDRLAHALRSVEPGRCLAVLFLDVDRFKLLNDSLGHSAGDQALVTIASRLSLSIRPGDTLARFGGDEFVVLCEGVDRAGDAERVAARIRLAIAEPLRAGDAVVTLTASIGIVVSGADSTPESLLRDADTAMYEAKASDRGGYHVHDKALQVKATDRLLTENELRAALERNQLWVAYQPIVDVASRRIVAVESLLRWDHPALGSVPPSTFVPLAEEAGLIADLGTFAFEQSCAQLAEWRSQGHDLRLSVNLSPRQLSDSRLGEQLGERLRRHGIPPGRVCLELTESVLMADAPRTAGVLDGLRRQGLLVSIDDFGTGYSSLAYLHRFRVDELKIDRSFVQDLSGHTEVRRLVMAMIAMARALQLRIVAEGVESEQQLAELETMGCNLAQGYYIAPPGPPEAITPRLERVAARARAAGRPSAPTGERPR